MLENEIGTGLDTSADVDATVDQLAALTDLYPEIDEVSGAPVDRQHPESEPEQETEEKPEEIEEEDPLLDIMLGKKQSEPEPQKVSDEVQPPQQYPELTPEQLEEIREFQEWRKNKGKAEHAAPAEPTHDYSPEIEEADYDSAFMNVDGMKSLLSKNNAQVVQKLNEIVKSQIEGMLTKHQEFTARYSDYMVHLTMAAEREPHLYEKPEALQVALSEAIESSPGQDTRAIVQKAVSVYNKTWSKYKKIAASAEKNKIDVVPKSSKPENGRTSTRQAKKEQSDPYNYAFLASLYGGDRE